jgi:hypothetical protein
MVDTLVQPFDLVVAVGTWGGLDEGKEPLMELLHGELVEGKVCPSEAEMVWDMMNDGGDGGGGGGGGGGVGHVLVDEHSNNMVARLVTLFLMACGGV